MRSARARTVFQAGTSSSSVQAGSLACEARHPARAVAAGRRAPTRRLRRRRRCPRRRCSGRAARGPAGRRRRTRGSGQSGKSRPRRSTRRTARGRPRSSSVGANAAGCEAEAMAESTTPGQSQSGASMCTAQSRCDVAGVSSRTGSLRLLVVFIAGGRLDPVAESAQARQREVDHDRVRLPEGLVAVVDHEQLGGDLARALQAERGAPVPSRERLERRLHDPGAPQRRDRILTCQQRVRRRARR